MFQHQITDHYRIELDIIAADVQQPRYLIECRNDHSISVFLGHLRADAGKLALQTLTGITGIKLVESIGRYSRTTIRPKRTNQIHRLQAYTCLSKFVVEFLVTIHAPHLGIDTYRLSAFQIIAQPLLNLRAVDIRFSHQTDGCAFELNTCLQVVAAVCPEQSLV